MLNVLLLSAPFKYYRGGSELQYSLIDNYLTRRNVATKYLFRYPHEVQNQAKYITYNYRIRNEFNRYCPTDAFVLYNRIQSIKPHIIYKRGINYISLIGLLCSRKARIPYIQHIASSVDIHDRPSSDCSLPSYLSLIYDRVIRRIVIMNSSYIITQSNHQKSNIANIFGRTADAVIPNVFPARDATTFKSGVARVVWIGNLKPLKRPELFIKLASSLRKSGALFTMIGRDPNTEWSSQIKHSVAEVPNLEFLGELSIQHVNEILSESHILVNTSKYEGFPNTFIQAWMNRMPVVSIDIDPDDILTREGIGFVSRCFRDLTSNVRYLLDHEDVVKAMGEKAHEYALTNHDESNFDKLLEIFRSSSSYSGPIAHIFS